MNTHSSGYYSIDEEYTIIGMQAQEQGLTTVMEIEPEVYENPYIYGSPLHLIRAMMNIYSNCIKYNKENGEIRTHVRLLHSGYEATRQIRRLERTDAQSIPIIALTANAFAEDIQHAMDAGMNAHVAKPLNIKTIKKIIINQLK